MVNLGLEIPDYFISMMMGKQRYFICTKNIACIKKELTLFSLNSLNYIGMERIKRVCVILSSLTTWGGTWGIQESSVMMIVLDIF